MLNLADLPPKEVYVPAPIAGLMASLPAPGTHWPDVEKAKFMSALGHVLDLVYPEPEHPNGEAK